MPQGLAYSTSTGYLYDESTDEWIRTDGLYNVKTCLTIRLPSIKQLINRFESSLIVQSPIQRLLLSKTRQQSTVAILQKKPQKQRLPTMNNQNTNDLKATIQKRNEHLGEISVTLDKDQARVLDQTYSGNRSWKSLHFFVPETLVITDKDGNPIPSEDCPLMGRTTE